jgi:predicted lipoprotein with Yx(FWY)xxD motif
MARRPLTVGFALAGLIGLLATASVATAKVSVTMKSTENSSLGTILVSATGKTLYHDSAEKKNAVKCVGACAAQWPPLLLTSGTKPVAGPGITASLLGTVTRPDGKIQVTYAGSPLYLYAGDTKAGDVKGQGIGGIWHALTPTGAVVTKTVKSSGTTTAPKSSGSSGSGSGSSTGSGSGSGSGSSTGSGSGSSTGSGSGSGSGAPSDCATNPQGYGCM